MNNQVPVLVVDLDGTLVATDTLLESIVRGLRRSPISLALAFARFATSGDRALLKARVAEAAGAINPAALPYRQVVLDRVTTAHAAGTETILATGAHVSIARAVSEHLGVFSRICATETLNMTGRNKLERIRAEVGDRPFEYIGDSHADVPVWAGSAKSVVVEPNAALRRRVLEVAPQAEVLTSPQPSRVMAVLKQLRVHQWTKNGLVLIPLLASHRITEWDLVLRSLATVLAFSLVASAIYVMNDAVDVEADRLHHSKRTRPMAAGTVSVPLAAVLVALCLSAGFGIALALGMSLARVLAGYAFLSLAYTFRLKRTVVLDVVVLATLYCFRIVAGGAATGIDLSPWLYAFMIFHFFGLALVKRSMELARLTQDVPGRGYRAEDRPAVRSLGSASTLIGVLVFSLYVNESSTQLLYPNRSVLWLAVPLMLYWSSRLWLLENRNAIGDDPLVFVITDRVSLGTVILVAAIVAAAAW